MGYWDLTPPSGHHPRKPLTKAQLWELEMNYKKAALIWEKVKVLEAEEKIWLQNDIDTTLSILS